MSLLLGHPRSCTCPGLPFVQGDSLGKNTEWVAMHPPKGFSDPGVKLGSLLHFLHWETGSLPLAYIQEAHNILPQYPYFKRNIVICKLRYSGLFIVLLCSALFFLCSQNMHNIIFFLLL